MSRPLKDRENRKFDSQDRVKVSVEEDNSSTKNVKVTNTSSDSIPVTLTNSDSSSDLDVTVKNTDSDAVPVKIINTDANIDVEVSIPGTVEINDSTPVDVNITNTSVNTNATIQNSNIDVNLTDLNGSNRLPVSVDNIPTVTVSGTLPTTFTNTDIRTRKHYSASDITALGSSTDVTVWTSALADGVLTKEFVESYQSEFEQVTLHTHPNLGDGNKALKKIVQYSTQNNATVIESIDYLVIDWNKDSSIEGSVSISAGAITSPDPSGTIAMHTVVTTLTVTDNTLGGITLSLSGTNASLYHLHEVETGIHSQTSLTYVAGRTYQVHAHSGFPTEASYSHSITVTATGDVFGISDSVNIATTGTYTAPPSYANDYYVSTDSSSFLKETININMQSSWSISFWYRASSFTGTGFTAHYFGLANNTSSLTYGSYQRLDGIHLQLRGSGTGYLDLNASSSGFYKALSSSAGSIANGNWRHIAMVWTAHDPAINGVLSISNTTSNLKVYIDNVELGYGGVQGGTPTMTDTFTLNELRMGKWLSGTTETSFDMDEVALFDYALSSGSGGDIEKIYNSGTPADLEDTAGLTAPTRYFRFENNSDLAEESVDNSTSTATTNVTQKSY